MPKGRGSNERRRNQRQKMSRRVTKIHALGINRSDPAFGIYRRWADAYERRRKRNMRGKTPKIRTSKGDK